MGGTQDNLDEMSKGWGGEPNKTSDEFAVVK